MVFDYETAAVFVKALNVTLVAVVVVAIIFIVVKSVPSFNYVVKQGSVTVIVKV